MATVDFSAEFPVFVVPPTAMTLEGFSNWVYSEDFPEHGKIAFINGRILVDMSPERYETHVKLKGAINRVLGSLVSDEDLGEFYPDGGRLKNITSQISNEPDAMFASWKTLESGQLAIPEKHTQDSKHVDLHGTPDWVCEIISDSSVTKDTRDLRVAYHQAGIPEYWLVDARNEEIDFKILVRQTEGYVEADNQAGWQDSPVFDRQFQLTRQRNRVGSWKYELAQRQSR